MSKRRLADVPENIGSVVFGVGVGWVMVSCPRQYNEIMRRAGGTWDAGARQWLIERRRIGPDPRAGTRRRSIVCAGRYPVGLRLRPGRLVIRSMSELLLRATHANRSPSRQGIQSLRTLQFEFHGGASKRSLELSQFNSSRVAIVAI
jgi:hypothetical protein